MDAKKEIIIYLEKYDRNLRSRQVGKQIESEILEQLSKSPESLIIFDFTNVESLSTGLAYELFGKLWLELKDNFKEKIKFSLKANDNRNSLLGIIIKAIAYAKNEIQQ